VQPAGVVACWGPHHLLALFLTGSLAAGKTRTILNLLSVVMHSAAKGSLELVPSVAKRASSAAAAVAAAAAAASAGSSGDAVLDAAAERQRLWQQQSPWMFGQPTVRDLVGPTASTGEETLSDTLGNRSCTL
jgi:hypothetical protein